MTLPASPPPKDPFKDPRYEPQPVRGEPSRHAIKRAPRGAQASPGGDEQEPDESKSEGLLSRCARALVHIVGNKVDDSGELVMERGEDGKDRGVRHTFEPGQPVPDSQIAGLREGVHYTRGRLPGDPREKFIIEVDGTKIGARKALVDIVGHPAGADLKSPNLERVVYRRGDLVPCDQLGGLREDVHYA